MSEQKKTPPGGTGAGVVPFSSLRVPQAGTLTAGVAGVKFDVARQQLLRAWRAETRHLCRADAEIELEATIAAMRQILIMAGW